MLVERVTETKSLLLHSSRQCRWCRVCLWELPQGKKSAMRVWSAELPLGSTLASTKDFSHYLKQDIQQFFHVLYSGAYLCNYLSLTFSTMWTELYDTGIASHSMKRTSLVPLWILREFLLFRILHVSLLFCSGSWDLVLLKAWLEVPQAHGVTHLPN